MFGFQDQDEDFVTLAYFSNSIEAGMVCELLRNNGIDVRLRGENFGALEPLLLTGGFSEIKMVVSAAEYERAKEIYEAFFENESESLNESDETQDAG